MARQSVASVKARVVDGARLRQTAYARLVPVAGEPLADLPRTSEQVPVDGVGVVERATARGFALRGAPSALAVGQAREWVHWPPAGGVRVEEDGFTILESTPRVDGGRPVALYRFAWA